MSFLKWFGIADVKSIIREKKSAEADASYWKKSAFLLREENEKLNEKLKEIDTALKSTGFMSNVHSIAGDNAGLVTKIQWLCEAFVSMEERENDAREIPYGS